MLVLGYHVKLFWVLTQKRGSNSRLYTILQIENGIKVFQKYIFYTSVPDFTANNRSKGICRYCHPQLTSWVMTYWRNASQSFDLNTNIKSMKMITVPFPNWCLFICSYHYHRFLITFWSWWWVPVWYYQMAQFRTIIFQFMGIQLNIDQSLGCITILAWKIDMVASWSPLRND